MMMKNRWITQFLVLIFALMICGCDISITETDKIYEEGQSWSQSHKSYNEINDICEYQNTFWLATSGGVIQIDKEGKILTEYSGSSNRAYEDVTCIAVDSTGSIWLGNKEGTVTKITNNIAKTVGNHCRSVNTIEVDKQGRVWMSGCCSGFAIYQNETLAYHSLGGNQSVNNIAFDYEGNGWLQKDNYIYRYDNEEITNVGKFNGSSIDILTADKEGYIWVGHHSGGYTNLDYFDGQDWNSAYRDFGYIDLNNIQFNNLNQLLVKVIDKLYKLDGVNLYYLQGTELPDAISSFFIDSEDKIWFPSSEYGLYQYKFNTYEQILFTNSITHNDVNCLETDDLGNLYAGTANGLSKFDGQQWLPIADDVSFNGYDIRAISFDNDQNLWVASNEFLLQYKDNEISRIYINGYPYLFPRQIAFDNENNIWVGTAFWGIYHYNGTEWIRYYNESWLGSNKISQLKTDPAGNVWVLSGGVLSMFNGNEWKVFSEEDGLPENDIIDIDISSEGLTFISTRKDIYILKNSKFQVQYHIYHTLYSFSIAKDDNICIVQSSNSNSFVSTGRIHGSSFVLNQDQTITFHSALSDPLFGIDSDNNLWYSTQSDGLTKTAIRN